MPDPKHAPVHEEQMSRLPDWSSNDDLARRYGVPLATVTDWRHRGVGPAGVRFGKHVRYSRQAIIAWENERASASRQRQSETAGV